MARKYFCNFCGEEIDYHKKYYFEVCAGYGSKYDGEKITFDFCPSCLDMLVDLCKINPVPECDGGIYPIEEIS